MNGYFQISINDSGTFIKFYPPKGGVKVSIKEVTNYLNRQKLTFDLKQLNDCINASEEKETSLFLTADKVLPIPESCVLSVSPNRMEAVARFYPASENGRIYDKEGVYSELRIAKVTKCYCEENIEKWLANKCYCEDVLLAKGIMPREGKDASIEYFFETDPKARPALKDDGSVDFYSLNTVNHIKAGDVLAVLTPEDPGDPGEDIVGNIIKPHEVKRLKLSYGLNIDISEDRRTLTSKVDGHVNLVDGKVFVSNVLEVENVDTSTGNLTYEGNIKVNGNICSNFSVKCNGSIEVLGVVEGAFLEAGNNITLARGINGMGKGTLKAGGNVVSKFLENCHVEAGGFVETESILHSVVQAKTEVNVVSRKGFITGGSVSACNVVRVKTLGTAMGSDTEVTVGIDPSISNRYKELAEEIQAAQKQLKISLPVLDASKQKLAAGVKLLPDQIKSLQALALTVKNLQDTINSDVAELETLKEVMDSSTSARIEVTGDVYAGTRITISDVSMIVKDTLKYCKFTKNQGTVVVNPL